MASKALGLDLTNQAPRGISSVEKSKSIYNSKRHRLEQVKKRVVVGKRGTRSKCSPDSPPGKADDLDNRRPEDNSPTSPRSANITPSTDQLFKTPKAMDSSSANHDNPRSPVSIIEFDPSVMDDELYLHQIDAPKRRNGSSDKDGHEKKAMSPSKTSVAAFDPSVPFDEQLVDAVAPQKSKRSHGSRDDEKRLSELKFDLTSLSVLDPPLNDQTDEETDIDSLAYSTDSGSARSSPSI